MSLTDAGLRRLLVDHTRHKHFLDSLTSRYILAVANVDADGAILTPSLTSPPTAFEMTANLTGIGVSEVVIPITATSTRRLRFKGHNDNAGKLYIGTTGVQNDGTLDFLALESGDELEFDYNIVSADLYVIASEVSQILEYGVML